MRWGGGGGVEIKMPLCGCTGALAAIAVWSPFVKTAAPMTKTSASTCAPFLALTGKLVLLLCVFFIGIAPFCCFARRKSQQANITIPQKTANIKVFCNFFNSRHFRPALSPVIPAPAYAGAGMTTLNNCRVFLAVVVGYVVAMMSPFAFF